MTDDGLLGTHLAPLLARREEAWQMMLTAIQEKEPAYTRFATPEDEAEWSQGVLHLFELFLQLARDERRRLSPVEAEAVRATGARRADQGFDFAAVRASVRAAVGVARDYIMEEYAPSGPADNTAMRAVLDFLDWYGNQVEDLLHEGMDRRNEQRAKHADAELVQLVADVERDAIGEEDDFARRVRAVGCDPTIARGVVLLPDTASGAQVAAVVKTKLSQVVVIRRSDARTPHLLVVVALPDLARWPAAVAVVRGAAAEVATTAVAAEPCRTIAEYSDRYAAATVLVPYLDRLADGRSVLDATTLTPYSIVATLAPTARRWLRRDVLRGVETTKKVFEFLRLSVRLDFVLNAIEKETGWDMKTVRRRRAELEEATSRRYTDAVDQAALTLAYCAARLDD